MSLKINTEGIDLIKAFEGCRLVAYLCPAKVWTIGYGHTGKVNGKPVAEGMSISKAKAIKLLNDDLKAFEKTVNLMVAVDITENIFSALVSFTYNVGAGNLQKSTLLKKLNTGDYEGAAQEFDKWNKAGNTTLPGLTRRREKEKELFLTDMYIKPKLAVTRDTATSLEIRWIQTKLGISANGIWGSYTASTIREKRKSFGWAEGNGYHCTRNLIAKLS